MIQKLLLTAGFVAGILIAAALVRGIARLLLHDHKRDRARFWIAQVTHLLALVGLAATFVLVWFNGGSQRVMVGGWIAAGLAIVQRVRAFKHTMNREIIAAMHQANIGIASGTYAIVQVPTLEVREVN